MFRLPAEEYHRRRDGRTARSPDRRVLRCRANAGRTTCSRPIRTGCRPADAPGCCCTPPVAGAPSTTTGRSSTSSAAARRTANWSPRACWPPQPTTGTPPATAPRAFASTATRCCSGCPGEPVIGGREPAHAGLFVAKWRIKAMGRLDPATGTVSRDHDLWERTQGVQWVQFRLNAREDGIEIVKPAAELRQEGWESRGPVLPGGRPLDEPDLHAGGPVRGGRRRRRQPVGGRHPLGGRQPLRRRPGGGAALPLRRRSWRLPLDRHRSPGRRSRPVASHGSLDRAFR